MAFSLLVVLRLTSRRSLDNLLKHSSHQRRLVYVKKETIKTQWPFNNYDLLNLRPTASADQPSIYWNAQADEFSVSSSRAGERRVRVNFTLSFLENFLSLSFPSSRAIPLLVSASGQPPSDITHRIHAITVHLRTKIVYIQPPQTYDRPLGGSIERKLGRRPQFMNNC